MKLDLKYTRNAYGECLAEMGSDERIVVLDADVSTSTRTSKFAAKYPKRFFNVGCAEQDLIGTAAGLAYAGKIAFASCYAIFGTGRAWEQIRLAAHDNLNVKIVMTHAGLTNAPDGASHQTLEDIALLRVIPNMTVIVPADFVETKKAVRAAVDQEGPCYIRLSRIKSPVLFDSSYSFEIGKGSIVKEGEDLTIVSAGNMLSRAIKAAETLEDEEIEARVINLSTIKPIDRELLTNSAKRTGAIVTMEEHNIYGGLGSAVSEVISANNPVPIEMIGVFDEFGQTAKKAEELYKAYDLTPERVIKAAKKVLTRK